VLFFTGGKTTRGLFFTRKGVKKLGILKTSVRKKSGEKQYPGCFSPGEKNGGRTTTMLNINLVSDYMDA